MKATIHLLLAGLCLSAWISAAQAQDYPLVGVWTVTDPETGKQDELTITEDHVTFGAGEPPIPYRAERSGDVVSLFIGNQDQAPAVFTFLDADRAEFAIPGGPTIELIRSAAASDTVAPPQTAESDDTSPGSPNDAGGLIDELAAMLVPYGVPTRYEPLKQSFEQLLSDGWELKQMTGASGSLSLLLTNGGAHAFCFMVPRNLGQSDTALIDCRRLN